MAWKPSELLVLGVVIGAVVLWRASGDDTTGPISDVATPSVVAKPDEPLDQKRAPTVDHQMIANVELAAEQLMLSVGGMAECKLAKRSCG